jgi:hypothetical protein
MVVLDEIGTIVAKVSCMQICVLEQLDLQISRGRLGELWILPIGWNDFSHSNFQIAYYKTALAISRIS